MLCGDPGEREWRFGHIVIAGAVHPLLLDEVARALAMSRAQLDALLATDLEPQFSGDSPGSDAPGFELVAAQLRARGLDDLCAAAIVSAVPVPPPGDRPLVANLAPTMRTPWIGPVSALWQELIGRAARQVRLHELDAPPIILANDARLVQRALDAVVRATVTPPPPIPQSWRVEVANGEGLVPCTGAIELPERWQSAWSGDERTAPEGIRALFFLDDGALLVQRARDTLVVRDGAVTARHPSCLRAARSQHGTRVVCEAALVEDLPEGVHLTVVDPLDVDGARDDDAAAGGPPDDAVTASHAEPANHGPRDDEGQYDGDFPPLTGLAVLDLATGAYLRTFPHDVACVEGEKGEPEDLWLRDVRSGAQFASPFGGNDRPQVLGWTRDARFVWLGSEDDGGVVEVDTGIPQIIPARQGRDDEERAPPSIPFGPDAVDGDDASVTATALGLTPTCEWRFAGSADDDGAPRLLVYGEQRTLVAIEGAVVCAAFSPDASRIAVAIGDEVLVVDVNAARVSARFRVP